MKVMAMQNLVTAVAIGFVAAVVVTEARSEEAVVEAAPAVQAAPLWSWTGCYAGVNVGYAHGKDNALDAPFTEGPFTGSGVAWNDPPYETIKSNASSAIGGVELGCDYAMLSGTQLVIGAAADISALGLSGVGTSAISPGTQTSFDVDWITTIRGRVGVAPSPALLIYATGGYAAAAIDVRAFDFASASPGLGTMDVSGGGAESGWVIGAGGEWRFANKWSLSLEYLHFDFGDVVATGPASFPAGAFPRFENDLTLDTVRVGLKWRL